MFTVVGPAKDDGAEWCVLLKGPRLDLDASDQLRVRGTLRVIEHPAAVVNGENVPAWSEVRVTDG